MFTPNLSRDDRLPARSFRVPIAVVGSAVLGLSLLLSVGPALGAGNGNGNGNGANGNSSGGGGNGTSGNVKVHDAGTGVETSGGDNEPHVCDFWLGFTLDAPFEAGIWVVVSWAPTGDGSTVASGVYDTAGDGIDSSGLVEVPAGHYRAEWAATGATVSKKKTFWVDTECDETTTPADEYPADESASPAEQSPVEQSSGDESPGEESPAEESESTAEGSPDEDTALPTDELPLPADEELDLADESVVEEAASTDDQAVAEGQSASADEPPGTPGDTPVEEQPAQAADPGSTDAEAPPMQNQLGGTGVAGDPTMSDTAVPTLSMLSGLLTPFVALLLMIGLATARRGTRGDIRACLTASRVRIPLP